jgi:hypothetical protein
MKYLMLAATLLLAACGGGSGDSDSTNTSSTSTVPPTPTYPAQGTELRSECDGYTNIIWFTDGSGGEYSEEYIESEDCGWNDAVLDVTIVKGQGDRFDQVVIDIEYTQNGEPLEYEVTAAAGHLTRTETGITIRSDGRLGDHSVIIAGEEYQYAFVPESVCAGTREDMGGFEAVTDCMGYRQGASTPAYIYYGEPNIEDTRVVTWDVIQVMQDAQWDGVDYPLIGEPDSYQLYSAERTIEFVNKQFEKWGVLVHLNLVATIASKLPSQLMLHDYMERGELPRADFVANNQSAGAGYCGFAGQTGSFRDHKMKNRYLTFMSACSADTWMHEMGHAVGLGHGPQTENPGGGITFPAFAQGAGGGSVCGPNYDIMTYGGGANTKSFTSPYIDCARHYPDMYKSYHGQPSGNVQYSATGYAINRVRYDVSLVHDEWEHPEANDNPQSYDLASDDQMEIIYD